LTLVVKESKLVLPSSRISEKEGGRISFLKAFCFFFVGLGVLKTFCFFVVGLRVLKTFDLFFVGLGVLKTLSLFFV